MSAEAIDKVQELFEIPELPADLIQEALTVAGAKNLAQLGASCINVCFQEMGYKGLLSRAAISDVMTKYNTMEYRAVIARKNGIQRLIEYGKNGKETEKILSFAMGALIATVHLNRGLDCVRRCVIKLGFLDEGPGLQMRQKYEALMPKCSVPLPINPPSISAAFVPSNTTMDEQSSPLPVQQSSEVSFSENSSSRAATPETSLTSECDGFIPFNLPNEPNGLDLIDCDIGHLGNNQSHVQAIDTAHCMGLDSQFRQALDGLQLVDTMPCLSENCAFPAQTTALESTCWQGSVEVEAAVTTALGEEPISTATLSSTARKRRNVSDNDPRKPKRADTEVRASVFFREDIKMQCSQLETRSTELLTSILVQIADSSSFVCFRDAICASKTMESNKPRKISMHTSMADRLDILEELNGGNNYNAFLARYHILELFRNCGGHGGREDLRIIPYAADSTVSQPGKRGHPIRIALAEVTQRMMSMAFPSVTPDTEVYKLKKAMMKRHRSLASRFQAFVDKFGLAILCFIQPYHGQNGSCGGISDNKIREISENSLKTFIEILDQSQGHYLRAVCKAADPLLQYLVYGNSTTTEFAIESTDAADILQLPKGSEELLRLLQGTPRNASIAGIC